MSCRELWDYCGVPTQYRPLEECGVFNTLGAHRHAILCGKTIIYGYTDPISVASGENSCL